MEPERSASVPREDPQALALAWLAFHDDMADPKSGDLVARESTRLACAAVIGAQTTLDPKQMVEWTPNSRYGGHAWLKSFDFLNQRENPSLGR